jgi:hypothetical protein
MQYPCLFFPDKQDDELVESHFAFDYDIPKDYI